LVPLEETTDSFTGKHHIKGLPEISEYRQDGDIKTGFGVGNCTIPICCRSTDWPV